MCTLINAHLVLFIHARTRTHYRLRGCAVSKMTEKSITDIADVYIGMRLEAMDKFGKW